MQDITTLPDEVLRIIFKFVPPKHRRENVRLVCSRWNRICNDSILTMEDMLICDLPYTFDSAIPYFEQSQRKLRNLCLIRQRICWTESEIRFWEGCGHRIESISLKDTLLNLVDLKIMLTYCPNLRELSIRCSGYKVLRKLLENVEDYASQNFTVSSVTNFELSLEDHCVNLFTNFSLREILATFPNLVALEMKLPFSCVNSEETSISLYSTEYISVPGVIHTVQSMGRNLKSLCLRLNYVCNCHSSKFIDISKMLPQLEKIEDLKFASFNFFDQSFFQPCTPSMRLTKVTSLSIPLTSIKHTAKDFILLLLNSFINLHTLQLDQIEQIEIDEVLLQKLLTSSLKELNLQMRQFNLINAKALNFSANRTLERLTLCSTRTRGEKYASLVSIFVQNFESIHDLTIHFPNNTIMQHIFKYQKSLKNLRLEDCYECPKLGLTDKYDTQIVERRKDSHSICDLKDLESFQISIYNTESLLYEKYLSSLVLPKLKHFELKYLDKFIPLKEVSSYEPMLSVTCFKELIKAVKHSPHLEYLKFHFHRAMTQTELEQLLAPLKYLRFVFIKDSCYHISRCRCEKQVIYDYEKLFERCPSLQAVVHNYIRFYPDVIKKKIEAYPKDFRDFMTASYMSA